MKIRNVIFILLVLSVFLVGACQKQAVGSKLDNPEEGYKSSGGKIVTTTTTPSAYGNVGGGGSATTTLTVTVTSPKDAETWSTGGGIRSIDVTTNYDAKCRYALGTSSSTLNTKPGSMKLLENYPVLKKIHNKYLIYGSSATLDKYYRGTNYLAVNCFTSAGDSVTKKITFKGV